MAKSKHTLKGLITIFNTYLQASLIQENLGLNISDALRMLCVADPRYGQTSFKMLTKYYHQGKEFIESLPIERHTPFVAIALSDEKHQELTLFTNQQIASHTKNERKREAQRKQKQSA
jgi:hypothetical protein